MACWGPKLYQDDIAQEVRNQYKDQLKRGVSNEDITNKLIAIYQNLLDDIDDAPIFWFALADTQWELGRLLPNVKLNAIKWLTNDFNLKKWELESPKNVTIRKEVLKNLLKKLQSPMPGEKKITKYNLYRCNWKIGDAFAYKFESDLAKEKALNSYFLIIQKIDEYVWWPGHIVPIVYWRVSRQLPYTKQDIDNSEYIINSNYDGVTYRRTMITTSSRIIPKKLIKLGNFTNLILPENEVIRQEKISITSVYWKELEQRAINDYLQFNLSNQ